MEIHKGAERCPVCGFNRDVTKEHEGRKADICNECGDIGCEGCGYCLPCNVIEIGTQYHQGKWLFDDDTFCKYDSEDSLLFLAGMEDNTYSCDGCDGDYEGLVPCNVCSSTLYFTIKSGIYNRGSLYIYLADLMRSLREYSARGLISQPSRCLRPIVAYGIMAELARPNIGLLYDHFHPRMLGFVAWRQELNRVLPPCHRMVNKVCLTMSLLGYAAIVPDCMLLVLGYLSIGEYDYPI